MMRFVSTTSTNPDFHRLLDTLLKKFGRQAQSLVLDLKEEEMTACLSLVAINRLETLGPGMITPKMYCRVEKLNNC